VVTPGVREKLSAALQAKDFVSYERLVAEHAEEAASRDVLLTVPRLRGGIEVLEQAKALTASSQALAALDNLKAIWDVLVLHSVDAELQIDLGLLLSQHYYSGAIFEGYGPNVGFPICSGGRYDELLGKFGRTAPATGFVIGIERVLDVLDKAVQLEHRERFLVLYEADERYPVIGFASYLRSKRFVVTAQRVDDVDDTVALNKPDHVTIIKFKQNKLVTEDRIVKAMWSDFAHMFNL
ncbi:MAG TPA: ATP phosphoribosyltransferase regulatory subunit, partial [Bacilli bacterium]|nr:ATP phosphoribosyltransferase regulatory subunit [Bacilli bacterium]